ncbi:heterokaryon incompatibility protein Het-C domain-containing protein [Trichoderma aethiopicum]
MIDFRAPGFLLGLVLLVCLVQPAAAFGAGNIASVSKVEGQNWRHGDIEDALLSLAMAQAIKGGRKFNKRTVARVYFGNWLRDYSQAIDVATVKMVSAEAIRLLLCVLGFMSFGYGSGEFEVTAERVGCYRPEDHIDNPKGYAEGLDARDFDPRLRGPVDENVELAIDPETGMKNYIANERAGCMTSSRHVRNLFGRCIELGRRYRRSGNKPELYEALRLMGTGLHCLEDFFAHSNYVELALIEMGERDVFPHVGRNTQIELEGARHPVYPITTGTFGGVDFLHSVTGEVSDKLTQNEIDELEGALNEGKSGDTSLLQSLLNNLPPGILGNNNQGEKLDEIQHNAAAAQEETEPVSPRDPEEFTIYIQKIYKQIMPVIEFHDSIMKSISGAIENIPILPKVIEQLEEQLSIFVFSIIAPFIVPLIHQIRNELQTGSSEIIESSKKEQHIVFDDDYSSDPTHSMLSKDHFSNILNEIAGRTAARMLHWVVPQLMEAIDDDSVDVDRLLERIVTGVMHHPAQREMGHDGAAEARQLIFNSVQEWWSSMGEEQQEDYRRKLSPRGVMNGENHKEGVHDTGHGCAGKLKMRKEFGEPQGVEDQIAGAAANAIFSGATDALSGFVSQNAGIDLPSSRHEESSGGDPISGLISGMAGSLLGGAFERGSTERETSYETGRDGSYTQRQTEYGQQGDRYGQAEYSQTYRPDGGRESEYRRTEQQESYGGGYGGSSYEERRETHESSYGSYEQRTERREYRSTEESYGGDYGRRRSGSRGSNESQKEYGDREESSRHQSSYERRDEDSYGSGGYGRREEDNYGSSGYGRRDEDSYGSGGYGRRDEDSYGSGGYGRREEDSYGSGGYGRREEDSYGGEYGSREEGGHGRRHGHRRDDDDEAEDDEYRSRDRGGNSGGYRF